MSFKSVTAVIHSYERGVELSHQELAVLVAIANYADDDGYCWPSRRLLQQISRMKSATLDRWIAHLCERGILTKHARVRENGSRSTNGYQINMSMLSPVPPRDDEGPPHQDDEAPHQNDEGPSHQDEELPPHSSDEGAFSLVRRPEPITEPKEEPPPSKTVRATRKCPAELGGGGGGLVKKLKQLGVVDDDSIREVLRKCDIDRAWQVIEEFEAAVEAGAAIGPGLLVDVLCGRIKTLGPVRSGRKRKTVGTPPSRPPEVYLWRCGTCGKEHIGRWAEVVFQKGGKCICGGELEYVEKLSSLPPTAEERDKCPAVGR